MKFFLPITADQAEAEHLWEGMRLLLASRGLPTDSSRIHSLWFRSEGEPRVLQVGVEDSETFETIVSIYRAANAPFYWVLTPSYGILEGTPMPIATEGTKAVHFDRDLDDPPRRRSTPRRP
jgi:hypothetical protein